MTILVLVYATLAVAWSWLGAYAGVVSFGQAMFFGIGAYAVAVSNVRGGSPWYGALGGALAAVIVAAVCGALSLRGRGWTFAGLTLVLGALAEPFVTSRDWIAPRSVYTFVPHVGFLNLQFAAKWPYVLLALAVFAVAQAFTFGLRSSRLGLTLRALRANPAAARSVGISGARPRLIVLAASAFVTSVAGSFFAEYQLGVRPGATVALALSFDIALIGSIAGARSAWGAPLAALAFILITRVVPLHPAGAAGTAVLVAEGVFIVFVALLRSDGMWAAALRRIRPAGVRVAA